MISRNVRGRGASAEASINVRVKEVAAGGEVLGAKDPPFPTRLAQVGIVVSADKVEGKVVGAAVERMEQGRLKVDVDVNTVEQGGNVTGDGV